MRKSYKDNYTILPNGMKVLLVNDKKYKTSSIYLIINGGSIYETKSTDGYFHILEHNLFNSSKSMTKDERDEDYRKLGAKYNGGTNNTTMDIIVTCPSINTNKVFDLFYDMVFFPKFDKKEFAIERDAILSERANLLSEPTFILNQLAKNNVFKFKNNTKHPYSNSTIGTEESIKSSSPLKIEKLYHKFFKPSNMVFVIVGSSFDENKIYEKLVKVKDQDHDFTNDELNNLIKKCDNTIYKTGFEFYPMENRDSMRVLIVSKNPKLVYNDSELEYWTNLDNTNNPYIHDLFTYWYGNDNFSVLHKYFRGNKGLCYTINSYPIYNRFIHFNEIFTDIPLNKINDFIKEFANFVNKEYIYHKPSSTNEFKELVNCIKYHKDFIYYKTNIEAQNLGEQILNNHLYLKEIVSLDERFRRLDKITYKEFDEFIEAHFEKRKKSFNCFIAMCGPSKIDIKKEIQKSGFLTESSFQ